MDAAAMITGTLHCSLAVDWGDEIDLERAARLVPAEPHGLPRRRRTPATIAYRSPPLRFRLPSAPLPFPHLTAGRAGMVDSSEWGDAEAMVFDFGAANIVFRVPFQLASGQLSELAGQLAAPDWLNSLATHAAQSLFEQLRPAITNPLWSPLQEEYFIFELTPGGDLPPVAELLKEDAAWLAGLLRLDPEPMSADEVQEALRCRLSYRPDDVVLMEWAAAVVLDRDGRETLHTIEFANLQLLEYRFIDRKLEDALAEASRLIQPAARSWLPFWRTHSRPLRVLGEMRLDAVATFERASSALQLEGDQYLGRIYQMLSARFHLREWSDNVRRALDVAQGVHEILSSQSAMYRLELLELIVVLLIMLEIGLAFASH